MTPETPLAPGIWRLSSNLDEEDLPLLEGLWPVPHGLALHSYLIRGLKTVVIDPYCLGPYGVDEVAEDLSLLGLGWPEVDAVAFTGAHRQWKGPVPVWGAQQEKDLLEAGLQQLPGMLWHPSTGVLFSGVHWAGFGAVEDTVLSTEANGTEARFYDDEALRWWVTHPNSSGQVPDGTRFIAPAHGLLWPNPQVVVDRGRAWAGWDGAAEDDVAVVWSDAPDQDEMTFDLLAALQKPGFGVSLLRVPTDHESFVRAALRRASGLVMGPTTDQNLLAGLSKVLWRPVPGEDLVAGAEALYRDIEAK
jgi:flavorubredoxin